MPPSVSTPENLPENAKGQQAQQAQQTQSPQQASPKPPSIFTVQYLTEQANKARQAEAAQRAQQAQPSQQASPKPPSIFTVQYLAELANKERQAEAAQCAQTAQNAPEVPQPPRSASGPTLEEQEAARIQSNSQNSTFTPTSEHDYPPPFPLQVSQSLPRSKAPKEILTFCVRAYWDEQEVKPNHTELCHTLIEALYPHDTSVYPRNSYRWKKRLLPNPTWHHSYFFPKSHSSYPYA